MFAITRKIVYKWHGMGDGVRNGVEDEVLSVGWLGRRRREERDGEKGKERERKREEGGKRERRMERKRVRKESNGGWKTEEFVRMTVHVSQRGKILNQRSITTKLCD